MVERSELRAGVASFLAETTFAALTARDASGRLWTSPLIGPPGFLAVASSTELLIGAAPHPGDPLHGLPSGQPVGLIVMDFAARRRLRINGTLKAADGGGLAVDVVQAYGNCPQYIHPRRLSPDAPDRGTRLVRRGTSLQPHIVGNLTHDQTLTHFHFVPSARFSFDTASSGSCDASACTVTHTVGGHAVSGTAPKGSGGGV